MTNQRKLAVFGIGTYILSVLSSATDLQGNSTVPIALIAISAIATTAFIVLATISLWRQAKLLSITLVSTFLILDVSSAIQIFRLDSIFGIQSVIALNIVMIIRLVAYALTIIELFKSPLTPNKNKNDNQLKQRELAEKLYTENPDYAMRIAIGEEEAPDGIQPAAIYARVCEEVEERQDIDASMKLANSDLNTKISAEAQSLKYRSPDSAIELMKGVANERRKAFEKTLPKGKTYESHKAELIEELKTWLSFLNCYIESILSTQKDFDKKIEEIQNKTQQILKEGQLKKELWILRYALLHLWFLALRTPKNQNELTVNISLINRAFQDNRDTSEFIPWLKSGLAEYAGTEKLAFANLKDFELHVTEKIGEKIPLIVFDCTGGRLGGELHDFIIELLMTTIVHDKQIFESDDSIATSEETVKIKNVIKNLSETRKKASKDFFEGLINNDDATK